MNHIYDVANKNTNICKLGRVEINVCRDTERTSLRGTLLGRFMQLHNI